METFLEDELAILEEKGLRRRLRRQEGAQGREIIVDGRKVLNFCSNDYLGLAGDPRLREAAVETIAREGLGAGAARLVCGNMPAHQRLEDALARFKGTQGCLFFSTGYMANVGIISSIFGREDIIFSDRFNHASLIDGILLSQARLKRYPHRDMKALEAMIQAAAGFKKKGIITDSVFSMDGDIAPLDAIVRLAKRYDCFVMIDEAHALGVMGKNGRGLAEHFGVEDKIDIHMGTLSKAAGSFGAYCCGSEALTAFLVNKARSFIYTTGMPPAIAAASLKAVEIIQNEPARRQRLWENTGYMKAALENAGWDVAGSQTPIIPIIVGKPEAAVAFSNRLLEEGICVGAIRPPAVPQGTARLRLTVTAAHTREDLDCAVEKLRAVGRS